MKVITAKATKKYKTDIMIGQQKAKGSRRSIDHEHCT